MHEPINERSYGVIPMYKPADGDPLVLVLQHRAGHWGFPKGHLEADEDPLQAARRELCEETGIDDIAIDQDISFRQRYSYWRNDGQRHKEVVYYLGKADSQEVTIDKEEIADYRWLPPSELKGLLMVDGQPNEAAEQLLDFLKQDES